MIFRNVVTGLLLLFLTSVAKADNHDSVATQPVIKPTHYDAAHMEDFLVLAPILPIDGIHWGVAVDALKSKIPSLTCKFGEKDGKDECTVFKGLDTVNFVFKNGRLGLVKNVVTIAKNDDSRIKFKLPAYTLEEFINGFTKVAHTNAKREESQGVTRYGWLVRHARCVATLDSANSDYYKLSFECMPSPYALIVTSPPAAEQFKLFDLAFGVATDSDITNVINTLIKGNSRRYDLTREDKVSSHWVFKSIDNIEMARFDTYDNRLASVTYHVDPASKNKISIYRNLIKKYGKPQKTKSKNRELILVNSGTRDEVEITIDSKSGNPNTLKSIAYSLKALSGSYKQLDDSLYERRLKSSEQENLNKKAF